MHITKDLIEFNINKLSYNELNINESVFFDIETTGFSHTNTKLYLIGCIYYDSNTKKYEYIQWFLDDPKDEPLLIVSFFEFIKNFKYLFHFNGEGFDIPYILGKCKTYNIGFDFSGIKSIDLYKTSYKLRKILKTENLKQKTLKRFFDVYDDDKYTGGELIEVYHQYTKTKDNSLLNLLMLHNLEDLNGMIVLLNLFSYEDIFNGNFEVSSIIFEDYITFDKLPKKETIIELKLNNPLTKRISVGKDDFYLTAFNNIARIKIDVYTDELKFFYPNYKDYYYLPSEDTSIHKSVAFYVDKNFRTQAKAANCYSKKTGMFLPQLDEVISPYFKIEYHDNVTYFEITKEFLDDKEQLKAYILHVLSIFLH